MLCQIRTKKLLSYKPNRQHLQDYFKSLDLEAEEGDGKIGSLSTNGIRKRKANIGCDTNSQ